MCVCVRARVGKKNESLKPVIHDATSWMQHVIWEVGSKKLDATLGDMRYDSS